MMPPSTNSSAAAQPLPPLPDMSGGPNSNQGQSGGDQSSFMSSILSGLAPIKQAVDGINMACKTIVQSGAIPGSEQICGQIISLANGLLPMAAQSMLQPMGGMQGGQGQGGMIPPPGAPPPMGQG